MLGLSACQVPGLNSVDAPHAPEALMAKTGSGDDLMNTDQYAQAFNQLFDDDSRTQGQSISGMTLGAGSEDTFSSSLLRSPLSTTPASPAGFDQEKSSAFLAKRSEEIQKILRFQIDATEKMATQLMALHVPADLQEKHETLLAYFSLSRDLALAMMDERDVLGPKLMLASKPPEAFEKKYEDKLEQLKELTPQAVDIMLEFQLMGYRAEYLQLRAENMLSETDYLEQIHQISPDLRAFSIFSMMMSMLFGSIASPH